MINFLKNNALYIILSLVVLVILVSVYRLYFALDRKSIDAYINDELQKYDKSQHADLRKIIGEGINNILLNESRYRQVKQYAKSNGTSVEQELVHAAIMQCISYGYIKLPTTTDIKA